MAYEGILMGMGNPLLDISAVVDEEFLQKYVTHTILFLIIAWLWFCSFFSSAKLRSCRNCVESVVIVIRSSERCVFELLYAVLIVFAYTRLLLVYEHFSVFLILP